MARINTLLLTFVLALVILAPGPVSAKGKGITGQELVGILQNEGYKAKLETDDEGDPLVKTHMAGVGVSIYFYDCEAKRCGSLQFVTGIDLEKGTTPLVINRFNSEYRYASAYLDEENDPFLQLDFEVLHANHAEHIPSQVYIWEDVLNSFLEATGYRDAAEDEAPATQAPASRG